MRTLGVPGMRIGQAVNAEAACGGAKTAQVGAQKQGFGGGPNHAVIIPEDGGNAYQRGGWIRSSTETDSGVPEPCAKGAYPFAEAGFV